MTVLTLLRTLLARAAAGMRTRHTARLVRVVGVFLVVVNLVALAYFELHGGQILPATLRDLNWKAHDDNDDNNHAQQPISNAAPQVSPLFESHVKDLFKKVESDPEKYWLATTAITEPAATVEIARFLAETEYAQSWANSPQLFYDIRFTLLMYLHELLRQYRQQLGNEQADASRLAPPTLPFHWADWMDLTALNGDLEKPLDARMSCATIRTFTNNDPDPAYFCLDNAQVSDSEITRMGLRSRAQLPGYVIHGHSSHDDRPFNDIRIIESKSYALTHNLPKPYRVVILNGDEKGGTYEFEVDQSRNQRLASSPIVSEYVRSQGLNMDKINDKTTVTINAADAFGQLKSAVSPKVLSPTEDVHQMYQKLRNPDRLASRQMALSADMFDYELTVAEQIAQFEKRPEAAEGKLPIQEQLYYNGLVECSRYNDKDEPTYFKMATIRIDDDKNRDREWGWHYDWRFFNGALNYDREGWTERELTMRTNIILDRLLRSWNRFAEEKGIITWIMHGPLLSWYWDGLMFPFDVDIDIQMPALELARLARNYNQTLVVEDPSEGYGRFLIDVGSYIHNRGISENLNHIDARFVDIDSGIYIDITGLSKSKANTPEEYNDNQLANINKGIDDNQVEVYNDRRKHFYTLDQLSPLRYSMLGGVPVFIPHTITDRLIFEYSKGLLDYEFHDWYFVSRLSLWLRKEQLVAVFGADEVSDENGVNREMLLEKVAHMTDDQAMLLLQNDNILIEYYLTKEVTDLHNQERQLLFDSQGRDNKKLETDSDVQEEYNKLVGLFRMSKPIRKALFDYEHFDRVRHHKE